MDVLELEVEIRDHLAQTWDFPDENWGLGRGPSVPWVSHLTQWARINHLPRVLYVCAPSLAPGSRTQMCFRSRQANRRGIGGKMVQFSLSQLACGESVNFCLSPNWGHLQLLFFQYFFSLPTSSLRTPKTWMLDHLISSHRFLRFYSLFFKTFSLFFRSNNLFISFSLLILSSVFCLLY